LGDFDGFFKGTYFQIAVYSEKSCSLHHRADPAVWLCICIVFITDRVQGGNIVQLGGCSVTAACVLSKKVVLE